MTEEIIGESIEDLKKENIRYKAAFNAACDYLAYQDVAPEGYNWTTWFLDLVDLLGPSEGGINGTAGDTD